MRYTAPTCVSSAPPKTSPKLYGACSTSDFVAVDTEFMREQTFWPQLCLIQIAAPEEAVIIDPLAPGLDLTPFCELMANGAW